MPTVTCEEVRDLDECGNGTITTTCTATDDCGNSTTISQTVTAFDMTAPELVGVPEDVTIDCDDDLPTPPEVTAIDNCGGEVTVEFEEIRNGGEALTCELSQPALPVCPDTENWAMRLFDTEVGEFFSNGSTTFAEFDDGTARIIGTVTDNEDPNSGYSIDARFQNRMTWEEWSNQDFPTSFKDECGTGGFESWDYYVFAPGSTITGFGRYAGTVFTLTHAPENLFFAYQVGLGANNVNESNGNGGWFFAEGELIVDGQSLGQVRTAADFAFDGDCCQSYEVVRTWTATDCSGNTSEVGTQVIMVDDLNNVQDEAAELIAINNLISTNPVIGDATHEGTVQIKVAPTPASDQAFISYSVKSDTRVRVDIVDMNGNVIQKISEENVSEGQEYTHRVNISNMNTGVYIIRVNTGNDFALKKLVVAK